MRRAILLLAVILVAAVLLAGCDLSIRGAAGPKPAKVGKLLTYTLTAVNTPLSPPPPPLELDDPQTVQGVTVVNTLPTRVSFVSARPVPAIDSDGDARSCARPNSPRVVVCELGTLLEDETADVKIVVRPTRAGQIRDSVRISGETALDPTPDDGVPARDVDPKRNNALTIQTNVGRR
jgi:hypothetical protein